MYFFRHDRGETAALLTAGVLAILAAACSPGAQPDAEPEAMSLLGDALYAPAPPADARRRMEADLAEARSTWERDPASADAVIWLGRRTAYLGRYREAIAIFSRGLEAHPDDPRLYRHRGHRYVTVREFDRAMADLERAASLIEGQPDEIEPDGQPNERGIPTSTLQSNIWYHLGLARYLEGDFGGAADAWARARDAVGNPDNLVAASNWLYLSLRRAGRESDAASVLEPIRADLDVIENGSYHTLLLLYRGERQLDGLLGAVAEGPSGTAVRYGAGAWLYLGGRTDEAQAMWEAIVRQPDWASFGHIAAEAELARR